MAPDVLSQEAIDAMVAESAPASAPAGDAKPNVVQVAGPNFSTPTASAAESLAGVPPKLMEALDALKERIGRIEADIGGVVAREKMMSGSSADIAEIRSRTEELASTLASLTGGMQTVSQHLEGTPGYGAKQTFVCTNCQNQGKVAVAATCTHCGTQTWWGWFPQQ